VKPDHCFLNQPKDFWANVRVISEKNGYSVRGASQIKAPALHDIVCTLHDLGLSSSHVVYKDGEATKTGQLLLDYFQLRADKLNEEVESNLMDASEARKLFQATKTKLNPNCPLPMNKQKGDKKAPAYLTGLVNMTIEKNAKGYGCDYDPRRLTTITHNDAPLRTMARRVDGCFPSTVNPVAVWEIKEYYYTTTFGSRVAGGVYESLLDGMELEELRESESIDVKHYLMVDAHYAWWNSGRSYLCRIFDMLHMGYVDEVLFGKEVVNRLPALVKEWVRIAKARGSEAARAPCTNHGQTC